MARFHPGVLGIPNGKIGNEVFRQINGKTFVSLRPDSYNISQTTEAKASRMGFSLVVKFAKLIITSPELSTCWKGAKINGSSAYHRVIKYNLPLVENSFLTKRNIITPSGFSYNLNTYWFDNLIFLSFGFDDAVLSGQFTSVEIFNILYLFRPKLKKYNPQEFIASSTKFRGEELTNEIQYSLEYSNIEKQLLYKYKNSILYTAVILKNKSSRLKSSRTIANELTF